MLDWDYSNLGVFGVLWLVIVLWGLINVFQSGSGPLGKAIWATFIVLAPGLGMLVWFFIGPKTIKRLT